MALYGLSPGNKENAKGDNLTHCPLPLYFHCRNPGIMVFLLPLHIFPRFPDFDDFIEFFQVITQ
jgi:hypothetical protein